MSGYLLLLFVKFHVWNTSTTAWNPIGGKAVCSHTSGKRRNTTAAGRNSPLGSLVGLPNSTCTQRKRCFRTRSSAWLFCSKEYFHGHKGFPWRVCVTNAGCAVGNIWESWADSPSPAGYHVERALWSCCRVNPWASAKYHQKKYKVRKVLDLSPGAGTLHTKLRQALSNQRAVGMCRLQR